MQIITIDRDSAERIERFESHGAWSTALGHGSGDAHVYMIRFEPGGEIGPHEAGFDQLFVVMDGSGWGAGEDGTRATLRSGAAALFRRGEIHSKGSEEGMTAIMIQISEISDPSPDRAGS